MKRYSLQMQAGVPVDLDHPGRFFTLLACVVPIEVSLQQGSLRAEVLEGITPGIWADFGDTPFTRVRVVSPVTQTVSFILSMIRTGWAPPPACNETYDSDLSNTGISATVFGTAIDLGEEWADVKLTAFVLGITASAGAVLSIRCANDSGFTNRSLAVSDANPAVQAYNTFGSQNQYISAMIPTGRYVRAEFINGATSQGVGGKMSLIVKRFKT